MSSSQDPTTPPSPLWFLESIDRVNRTIQRARDLPSMLDELMQTTLEVFGCDRAWLLSPCDPDAAVWRVPVERTTPDYPGAAALGVDLPMNDGVARVLRAARDNVGAVTLGILGDVPLPSIVVEKFHGKSGLGVGVHPGAGPSYMLGLHQCTHARRWSSEERRLLEEIGRRIAEALGSFVAFEAVRASERRLVEAQRLAELGDWEVDPRSQVVTLSMELCRILEIEHGRSSLSMAEWERCVTRWIHPDDLERVVVARRAARDGGRVRPGRYEIEYRLLFADGRCRWIHSMAEATTDEHGDLLRLAGALHDVTRIRQAEEERNASERRFRLLVDHAADAIFMQAQDGTIRDVNQQACASLGYTREELVGADITLVDSSVTFEIRGAINARLVEGEALSFESLHRRKDGSTYPVEIRISPLQDEDGTYQSLAIVRDISERRRQENELRRLETELRQAQKMEAIGRLAGGIAHDFNNLLTIINGCGELALESVVTDPSGRELLGEVLRAGERAAQLTNQLLSFSRKQVLLAQIYDLDSVVLELLKMLRRLIGEDIELKTIQSAGKSLANVDRGQLEQAITNLVVNARHAMPKGGTLSIEVRNVDLADGSWVEIDVADTGVGMDAETQSRIFEPFFTTKGTEGTGLGLSMVYGFVSQSGGRVEVDSQLGKGTTFRLLLPRVGGEIVSAQQSRALGHLAVHGTETVLLVEDADAVRSFAKRVLGLAGFTVIEARNGPEALSLEAKHPDIQLCVTDMIMPQMSGRELAAELRARRPSLPVLFISGYSDEPIAELARTSPPGAAPTRFLRKPFTPGALGAEVRELLDAAVARRK